MQSTANSIDGQRRRRAIRGGVAGLLALAAAPAALAASLELHPATVPERRSLSLDLRRGIGAPAATVQAELTFRDGQSRIRLSYAGMKPAVLFGGEVTCYVLWAVGRSGSAENLGEVLVSGPRGKQEFSTARKELALLITAEPYYLVPLPSDLVVFHNEPPEAELAAGGGFIYEGFAPAADPALRSITQVRWDGDEPLDLLQARVARDIALREGARQHAPDLLRQAEEELAAAEAAAAGSAAERAVSEAARRSISRSAEAIRLSTAGVRQEAEAEAEARRRERMEALQTRAEEAEAARARAEAEERRLRGEMERVRAQRELIATEIAALAREKSDLEGSLEELHREKAALEGRLHGALSRVAETTESARGLVVNLPDILFDVNRADLKEGTRIILAKLAGILLLMPDLAVAIEGHTDATGSPQHNLELSRRRAEAVRDFLAEQGVDASRMQAVGRGMESPIADNDTAAGRQRNRRVEVVLNREL